jgi:hypothetical protein
VNAFIEFAIFGLFIFLFFVISVDDVRLRFKVYKLDKEVQQHILNYIIISGKMEEMVKKEDVKKIEETEGFLKFVSDSRDWAFQYIEKVQIAIKNFQDIFHPIAEQYYKDKKVYGLPTAINQEEFGKLFEAYKKLIDELPDEGKKK